MAEAAVLAGVGWLVSPIITRLLNEGFDSLGETNIKDRVNNLETTILPQFQLVIEAAEKTEQHKTKMEQWLRKLKDALYEAEDVLDVYKYQLLEDKVNNLKSNPTTNSSPQKNKLRNSMEKLEKIAAEAESFCKLLSMEKNESSSAAQIQQPTTDSVPIPGEKLFGRDDERNKIIKYLLDSSKASKKYSVVAIVGIGGVGKTTLARQVYNDKRLENKFHIKMWVCVSRKLDVFRHTREMIESASKQKSPPSPPPPPRDSQDVLKRDLIDLIKSKKVLLMLDDVWYDNSMVEEDKWENFIAPLAEAGNRGSKILVTTRTTNLPEALHPRYDMMMLQNLKEDDILSLVMHHAFSRDKLDNSDLKTQLKKIGKQIVQKLYGFPLAAQRVGRQLSRDLKISTWRESLEGDNLCDAREPLLWSYQRLDAPLQRCFSYFSLFPRGIGHNSEEMIHMWIAEGFVNSLTEDTGRKYFNELVSNCFLQSGEDGRKYYMHDLVHDLAENISKGDCFRIEEHECVEEIPLTIRHLYVSDQRLREKSTSLNTLENLRTLIINVTRGSSVTDDLIAAAMETYQKLRVLWIDGVNGIKTLPESVGDQKHLRYLNLHENDNSVKLPESLGKLYHLQLLNLPWKANLPGSLKNLINLRHFRGNNRALTTVPYIGRLTSLQALKQFDIKREQGYDIGQLKNMNEIRGCLTISYLENVEGKGKAAEASLKNKRHLESLSLEWSNSVNDSERRRKLDLEVLGGLQPHPKLTYLNITGYMSLGYPSCYRKLPDSLKYLCLSSCSGISSLPEHLPKSLDILNLNNCPGILSLPEHLPESLSQLLLLDCPGISSLPNLPESLKIIAIFMCPVLEEKCRSPDGKFWPKIAHIPERRIYTGETE